jgi:hypothetical protein
MKKLLSCSLTAMAMGLSTASFALDCKNLIGHWSGQLGNLQVIDLNIHRPEVVEDAYIEFRVEESDTLFGLLKSSCKKNPDGTVTIALSRNSYGIQANFQGRLIKPITLEVSAFSYSLFSESGNGAGTLHRVK